MKNPIRWLIPLILIISCTQKPFESVEETHEDGTPKLVKYYKTEMKEVLLREVQYYDDGKVYIEGSYKDGERDGTWTAWHRNGNVWSIGEYRNGKENGIKTVYHDNGQKYYEGEIINDERAGVWTFWNKDGEMLKKINYDDR